MRIYPRTVSKAYYVAQFHAFGEVPYLVELYGHQMMIIAPGDVMPLSRGLLFHQDSKLKGGCFITHQPKICGLENHPKVIMWDIEIQFCK